MNKIFISYSSADRGWAEVIEQKLVDVGVDVYRDKSRLIAAEPFQDQLFEALGQASGLLIIWSERVRDGQRRWKEWVITEREHFRSKHPHSPIVYLLLDGSAPDVDAGHHKLDDLRGRESPENIGDAAWGQLIQKIKKAALPSTIELDAYLLACNAPEFATLKDNPNLSGVLSVLGLKFDDVAAWYGPGREDWRLAGKLRFATILGQLEQMVAGVFKEDGVPVSLKGKQVVINSGLTELWNLLDSAVHAEIDRLSKLDFIWVFVDPLSLYHPIVQSAANRIAGVRNRNRWLNLFIVDPIGGVYDRSSLRAKLKADFPSLYHPMVKPEIQGNLNFLGGVDVWHTDDFERVFRETIRLRSQMSSTTQMKQSPQRGFTTIGAGD